MILRILRRPATGQVPAAGRAWRVTVARSHPLTGIEPGSFEVVQGPSPQGGGLPPLRDITGRQDL